MSGRVAAALAALLAAGAAHAQPAPAPPYQLAADSTWQPVDGAAPVTPGHAVLARLRREPPGQLLVITRLDHPNADRKRKAYRDQIVAALAQRTPGFRQLDRKDGEPSSSWTIDLAFERAVDGAAEVVAMRFYLVHDRTFIVAVSTPAPAWPRAKAATWKLVRSFKPR